MVIRRRHDSVLSTWYPGLPNFRHTAVMTLSLIPADVVYNRLEATEDLDRLMPW